MQPVTAKDGTPLDPSVVALAKSIKQVESGGNYKAMGKSREFGAYQFTEPTWRAWAGKYLGNPNAFVQDPTMQDKVAYAAIKDMKDKGMTPEQVVSTWNSGKPNAYAQGHRGINKYGVVYDTPAYVNKVMEQYNYHKQEYLQSQQQPVTGPQLSPEDTASAQQYGATFPADTSHQGSVLGEGLKAGLKAAGNFPSSLLHAVKGVGSAVLHPIETGKGLINLGIGAVEKALPGTMDTPQVQAVNRLGDYANARYGTSFGPEKFNVDKTLRALERTATNDPFGFGSEVLAAAKGVAKIADLATGAKFGGAQNFTQYIDRSSATHANWAKEAGVSAREGIASLQKDIVDNLAYMKASPEITTKIASLDPTSFSSVDDFAKAAKAAVGAKGLYSELLNRGIEKTADIALAPARAAGRAARNISSGILGSTTGEGYGTVNEATKAALGGPESRQTFIRSARGQNTPDDIVREARAGLDDIFDEGRQAYQQNLKAITDNTRSYDISSLHKALDEQLAKYNVKVTKDGLDFSRSSIANSGPARADIQGVYETIKSWGTKPGDRTAVGLDTLKQQLGDFYSPSNKARAFVQGVKSTLWNPKNPSDSILGQVEGYGKLTGEYSDNLGLIRDIKTSLSLGGKAGVETTFKKLIGALRSDNQLRSALAQEIDNHVGGGLIPKLAGSDMSQFIPGGLTGLAEKVGGATAILRGVSLRTLLPLFSVASPRMVAEFLNALGWSSEKIARALAVLKPGVLPVGGTSGLLTGLEESNRLSTGL